MVSAGLPQKMADAITVPGCDSQDVFRSAFVDKNAFETWLCKSRDKLGDEASGVDAGDWTTCPLAAKLRLFLSGLQPPTPVGAPAVTPSKESSLALLPFASSQSKVSANERDAAADRKRLSISSENTCFPLPDQLKVFVGLLQLEMGEKKQIQNLLAHELISKENLGQLHNLHPGFFSENSLFQSLDKDNSGTVEVQEAREVLEKAGLNQNQIGKFLSGLLGDKGSVHYTEFMAKLVMAQRGVREEEIGAAFASIDLDGSGTLDVNEVEKLLQQPDAARLLEGRAAKDVIEEMVRPDTVQRALATTVTFDPSQFDCEAVTYRVLGKWPETLWKQSKVCTEFATRNADGVVDFKEFRRAMLGDPNTVMFWKKGDAARFERWIPCRVEDVDQEKDSVIIDLKPGVWLTPEDMKHRLVPGNTCWSVGAKCQYYSREDGFFLDATVMELDDKGNVIVDKRPGQWLPPWAIW
ncbi:CPK14, partial [Symbiodinium sp. KB8]